MIIEPQKPLDDLVAFQVLLKVQPDAGHRPHPAIRGYLYEVIERSLVSQLSAIPPRARQNLALGGLTAGVERELQPLLANHSLKLHGLSLKPLRLEGSAPPEPPLRKTPFGGPSRFSLMGGPRPLGHQWVEAAIGPFLLKDQFLLTVEAVVRIKCHSQSMEGRLEQFGSTTPGELLITDMREAFGNFCPDMTLEDWNRSSGLRAGALILALSERKFVRWLHKAHVSLIGAEHDAGIEACWITESRIEPAYEAFRPHSLQVDSHAPPREI